MSVEKLRADAMVAYVVFISGGGVLYAHPGKQQVVMVFGEYLLLGPLLFGLGLGDLFFRYGVFDRIAYRF